MADVKITELPPASSVTSATILPTVSSSSGTVTEQATVSQLANGIFPGGITPSTYGSGTYAPVITVDSLGRVTAINQTAITAGSSAITGVFNVRNYGAVGDGTTNDYVAINNALTACAAFLGGKGGTLYFPAGVYYIGTSLSLTNYTGNITVLGDGPKSSVIKSATNTRCITFSFAQDGSNGQPYACTIANMGFRCAGAGPADHGALWITYTVPSGVTISHRSSGPVITNCEVRSVDSTMYWPIGIEITSAWNTLITDCFISGYSDGNWNNLTGVGIFFHKSCVNSSVTNTQVNFFKRGLKFDALEVPSQGLYITDCTFVGVATAGYFDCAFGLTYNLGSILWTGGIIDLRTNGTPANGFAIYATYVDDMTISNVEIVTDDLTVATYAVYLDNCKNVSVNNCQFHGFNGVGNITTLNACTSISVLGNRFIGSTPQLWLSSTTTRSLYRDSVLEPAYSITPTDVVSDLGSNNIVETSVAGVSTTVYRTSNQSIAVGAEAEVVWTTALVPSQFGIWSSAVNPSHLTVPTGARKVKLTANIRWASGSSGTRIVKIKGHPYPSGVDEVFAASQGFTSATGSDLGDDSIATGVIPVCQADGTRIYDYFVVTVAFVGGSSPIDVRGVAGTNFSIEVVA